MADPPLPPSSPSILYPTVFSQPSPAASSQPSLHYPDPFSSEPVPDASQELLLSIPSSIAHLIDAQHSIHLASGDFSLVRLTQLGNGIAVFARIGADLQWPLTKDQASVKLDPYHYFFSLSVPPEIEEECRSSPEERNQPPEAPQDENLLNYGITFAPGTDTASLKQLDEILEQYSFFIAPSVVPKEGERDGQSGASLEAPSAADASAIEAGGILKSEEIETEAKEIDKVPAVDVNESPLEQGSEEYWTLLAPNVEDYSDSIARAIAVGSGHVIKGIFWCSEATIAYLEKGHVFMKGRVKPKDTSTKMSPSAMRRIRRVRKISAMSEQVASSVLSGVLKAAAFVTKPLVTSKAGQKLLSLLPGQIALASLDAFGKIFDAVEVAGKNVLTTTSVVTTGLVSQRYGNEAAEFTQEGLQSAGGFLTTAWTVSKLRKVFYPSSFLAKSAVKVAGEELKSRHIHDKDEVSVTNVKEC